ncbi:hypothetical protein ACSU1N_04895 [Thermogladius sp. 4427co]|uniref:hypothetical protein n=1 Tax=Thermogladius sp. 4427co TaxID=3450718 RepID=UPI003F78D03D
MIGIGSKKYINLSDRELIHIGKFLIKGVCTAGFILLVGRGVAEWITGDWCIIVAERGLVKIDRMDCAKVFITSTRGRVIVRELRTIEGFIQKANIGIVKGSELTIGGESIIGFLDAKKTVFLDPHIRFEEYPQIEETVFAYKIKTWEDSGDGRWRLLVSTKELSRESGEF